VTAVDVAAARLDRDNLRPIGQFESIGQTLWPCIQDQQVTITSNAFAAQAIAPTCNSDVVIASAFQAIQSKEQSNVN
jgi:hypothetical protein